ncbi:hypothetical protein [Bifidobacterium sp. ESL0764]|uniref:DUF6903 family protein n=1 Tax=Bifidobacterium sp. ESL0764 TaxID=2983228 RepID=UPI0023F7943B|nr:hypothetical protein [Bifidobacterium sp. ESL0764]WEV66260.1 hypothetical protein OZX71_02640 [Bifidobacterium sp. ESL0764]
MNEKWHGFLLGALKLLVFVAFIVVTIIGQRSTSWLNLGIECIGLAGVVFMLWLYNHSQR